MALPDIILTVGFNNTQTSQAIAALNNQLQRGLGSGSLALGRITGKANEFQKSLEASNARVIAFGASAGAIYALRTAFTKLVSSTIEVEQALKEINVLLNLGTDDLQKFASGLFQVANATGRSFADAAKAAQEFSRQGLGVEAVLQRTQSALTLTRLSGLALEDSVSSLTATLNSFHREALDDIEIVNRLANVDAKFAVSSADLAEALKRVASSASDAGVSFNETIALVTAAQQATARGGAVIGNSFKTIFTRLQRPQVLEDLESVGVAIRDSTGKTLPLIQVLTNLANTYDTLSSAQKSFIGEAVGGVYQINILKSILGDLGSGYSVFRNAVDAANSSTLISQQRLLELNNTISGKLIQTLNNLTQASANIGESILGPSLGGGLGGINRIIKLVNDTFAKDGAGFAADILPSGIAKSVGTVAQGLAKGLGNVLTGPGIQFAVFGLIKLFQKLQSFAIDSVKDLTGINAKVKERAAVEQLVINYLDKERTVLRDLLQGNKSYAQVHDEILQKLKEEQAIFQSMAAFAPKIATALQHSGIRVSNNPAQGRHSALGFVPNLESIAQQEAIGARMGGYSSGKVVATSVSSGGKKVPMIANTAETKSSVRIGDKIYEWINPPQSSPAGKQHANRSKSKTGIDPYSLKQYPLAASGLVPTLNIEAGKERFNAITDFVSSLKINKEKPIKLSAHDYEDAVKYLGETSADQLNKDLKDGYFGGAFPFGRKKTSSISHLLRKRGFKFNSFFGFVPNLATYEGIPLVKSNELVQIAKQRLNGVNNGDGDLFEELFKAKSRQPAYPLTESKKVVVGLLRSARFKNRYINEGGYLTPEGNKIAESIVDIFGKSDLLASKTKAADLDPNDVQKMLSLRGEEFVALVGFGDFVNKTSAGAGSATGQTQLNKEGGPTFKVPFRYAGLLNPKQAYEAFRKQVVAAAVSMEESVFGVGSPVPDISNEGQTFGNIFDTALKSRATKLGIKTGQGNENLDILGYSKDLVSGFSQTGPFAGADVKTSLGSETAEQMATKIARVLALKRGAGQAEIPPFQNVGKFTGNNIGLLDYDYFPKTERARTDFDALVYAALSKGKPLRVHYGPAGSGKTTSAFKLGAKPVLTKADLEKFNEYIFVTSVRKNLSSGIMGLALASASNIVGFNLSKNDIIENIRKRAKGTIPSGDTRSREELEAQLARIEQNPDQVDYEQAFSELKQKFGNMGRFNYFAATGFSPIVEALKRENRATMGNATLGQSNQLISPLNPLGLAAIDKRNQRSADEAIQQHKMMGESLGEIKFKKSSGGHIPNLVTDNSNQILISALLAGAQNLMDLGSGSFKSVVTDLRNSFGSVVGLFDKSARQETQRLAALSRSVQVQRDWIATVERARTQLQTGEVSRVSIPSSPGSGRNRRFTNADDIGVALNTKLERASKSVRDFDEALSEQKKRIQKAGLITSIGGALAGGVVSQGLSKFNPDLSAGFDQFLSGLTTGGQVLTVFQNSVGKALFGFSILTGAVEGVNTFVTGLESARKQFERQQTATQKLVSNLGALESTLATLDTMLLDSTVSLDTINKEQRKYQETLAKIATLNPEIATKIQTAPNSTSKLNFLREASNEEGKKLDRTATLLQIKELIAERGGLFSGLSGGAFAFRTPDEDARSAQVIQNTAFDLISSLPQDIKNALIDNVNDKGEFRGQLFGSEFFQAISKQLKGRESDVNLIVEQVRSVLGQEFINRDPRVVESRRVALENNKKAQSEVDNASRNEIALKRLFVNAGAIQGTNILDQRRLATRGASNQSAILEANARANSNLTDFFFSEKTSRALETDIERFRIESDRTQKLDNVNNQASRGILGILSQSFDKFANLSDTGLKSTILGTTTPSISENDKNILEALNKGISSALSGGDFTRFFKEGQIDFASLEKNIVQGSGATGQTAKAIENFLSNNRGNEEYLKILSQTNNDIVEVNQDALKELQIQNQKLEAVKAELKARREASFLGGSNLFDRDFRRRQRRDFIRGGRLLENGSTEERRAEGAFRLLQLVKERGGTIRAAGRDSITGKFIPIKGDSDSEREIGLLNKAIDGLALLQKKEGGKILERVQPQAASFLESFIREHISLGAVTSTRSAGAAIGSVIKPDNEDILRNTIANLNDSTTKVGQAFEAAINEVNLFSNALGDIRKRLDNAIINRETAQKTAAEVNRAGQASVTAAQNQAISEGNFLSTPQVNSLREQKSNLGSVAPYGIAAATLAAGAYAFRPNFRKSVNEGAKNVFRKGRGFFGGGAGEFSPYGLPGVGAPPTGPRASGGGRLSMDEAKREVDRRNRNEAFRQRAMDARAAQDYIDFLAQERARQGKPAIETPSPRNVRSTTVVGVPTPAGAFGKPNKDFSGFRRKGGKQVKSYGGGGRSGFVAGGGNPFGLGLPTGGGGFGSSGFGSIGSSLLLNSLSSFLPTQEENDGLRSVAALGSFTPHGRLASVGVAAGEFINDRAYGRLDRETQVKEAQYGEFLGNNPLIESILNKRREIEKLNKLGEYQETSAPSFLGGLFGASSKTVTKRRELSPETSATRDKMVTEYNRQVKFLQDNGDLNRLDKEQLEPLFEQLAKRIEDIRLGKDVSSEINVNLKQTTQAQGSFSAIPIKIEISIKDADKIPDLFNNKVIKPLEQQLRSLQNRASDIEQYVGIEPKPAI